MSTCIQQTCRNIASSTDATPSSRESNYIAAKTAKTKPKRYHAKAILHFLFHSDLFGSIDEKNMNRFKVDDFLIRNKERQERAKNDISRFREKTDDRTTTFVFPDSVRIAPWYHGATKAASTAAAQFRGTYQKQ